MNWTEGIQKAVDYIEEHITETVNYDTVAAQSFSSGYHFQRVFSIICGFTVGEYIRRRRLTLAGEELAAGEAKIIDIALKYGYKNPDSFAKAFRKFHGILPSEVRLGDSNLNSFSRLVLNFSMKGGEKTNYRIEEKDGMILTGYGKRFTGAPYGNERKAQEGELFTTTRAIQWLLRGASTDPDTYCVISDIDDEGYDFYYCNHLDGYERNNLYNKNVTGVNFMESLKLKNIIIPRTAYLVFKTENPQNAVDDYFNLLNLRLQILTEWMPENGFQLAKAPELSVYHWTPKNERNIRIWMPIEKIR